MNVKTRGFLPVALLVIGLVAVLPCIAAAQVIKDVANDLSALSLTSDRLSTRPALEPIDDVRSALAPGLDDAWAGFRLNHGEWSAYVDSRSGRLEGAEGSGIAWVPGRGNRLSLADIAGVLGGRAKPDLTVLEAIARKFVDANGTLLGVDNRSLRLNQGRSGQPADYLWFVDFDVERDGLLVEGARVVFRVNHGNLIQFGTENLPSAELKAPPVNITREKAYAALAAYVGGIHPVTDTLVDPGSLRLLPATKADGFAFGKGYDLAAVWQILFRREGLMGTWRGRVDATTGDVVEFYDVNDYAQATGGVFANSPTTGPEIVRPMPFTNLSSGGFANSAGVYNFGGGALTSSLNGQYVRITDTCGAISLAANGVGDLLFGTSAGTNCTTPGVGGAGNTHASRMQFYHVNRAKEVGRGWLPANAWLNGQLTANVNLNQTCNAYWNGSSLNFFRSGGGCGNTGELAGVSLHEYGHGLDSNDGNGSSLDNGTGETYGDFTAALATHSSCIGAGFLGGNCAGYGDACTSCTGVRDIDWAKHVTNTPHTVANFTQTKCPNPSPFNPNYKGPCGKEGHCESYIASEALWDLAARDLPNPGSGAAWSVVDRLWYLSRSTSTRGFLCTASGTWTSNGCGTGTYWRTMRAVDDDDGNLNNGTPHGGALFAAFNRHGIACTTDTGASTTFAGCTPPATPTLTLTPANNSVSVSWTSSGAAVYDVYRNESGCNAGFVKAANDVAGTSLADNAVGNGLAYFYQVTAHPSGNEACASAPSACLSVTPAAAPCTPPAAPTGLTATAVSSSQINLSWTAVAGATEYHILRSTTSGGPYTQVGTSLTNSFSNTGLACNTTYFYVVRAANSATCESGNSNQASATTSTCSCTTTTLYTNTFETGTGLSNWTKGSFGGGGTTTSWRGIQTCTAQGGTKIFRFGGTSCTADYTSNNFNFAQPNGAGGIAVGASANTTRLTFGHRRGFESGFDGGTLTLSVDGVNYFFVPGSAILSGGYNGTVAADCAPTGTAGTGIWTGNSAAFTTTTVDLDAACNAVTGLSTGCAGRALRIGFTTITDCSVTGDGWFLDNVTVTACQ